MQSAVFRFCAGRIAALFCALFAFGNASQATAGAISTPSLSSIFSQPSFGAEPITVNWLSAGPTIVSSSLAVIDSNAEINALYALAPNEFPAVTVFFVDAINFCEGSGSFVGCAQTRGHDMMVTSGVAAGSLGSIAIAHELSHNLGLVHDSASGNLMNPFLTTSTKTLTVAQTAIILNNQSDLLRVANDGSVYINLRPVSVVTSVPEPHEWLMLIFGFAVIAAMSRRSHPRVVDA